MANIALRLPALLLALTFFLAACDAGGPDAADLSTTSIIVANQGNFSDANGSVTVYDPTAGAASPLASDLVSTVQSAFVWADTLYVLANTANRIDVFNLETGARRTIDGVLSPRYMARTPDGRAYVTSLYGSESSFSGGNVLVVDLDAGTVDKTIPVGDNPEGIAIVDTLAFVANSGFGSGSTVSVIDVGRDEVIATIDVGCDGPRFVLEDDEEDVWVTCSGRDIYDENFNLVDQTDGAIRVLNADSLLVEDRLEIDGQIETAGPGQDAAMASEIGQLFVVVDAQTILRFDTRSNELVGEMVPAGDTPIGAVAFDGVEQRVYVGRVPGFTEPGSVDVLDLHGAAVDSFQAGVSPTYVTFRHTE